MSTPKQDSVLASRLSVPSASRPGGLAPIPSSSSTLASELSTDWVVQKYGGTSVGKFLEAITSQVVPSYLASLPSLRLALVCSARSGSTKAKGTTNLLLTAATQALESDKVSQREDIASSVGSLKLSDASSSPLSDSTSSLPGSAPFEQTVDVLLQEHLVAVDVAVRRDAELRKRLEADVRSDCERLMQFLQAAKIIEEISPRSKDIILSLGERLSCRLICASLQDLGIPAQVVGLESVIDSSFLEEVDTRRRAAGSSIAPPSGHPADSEALLDQHFYDLLAERMGQRCRAVKGVPVVTGELILEHAPLS